MILKRLLLLFALLFLPTLAQPVFDPVNDDTDIFLVNPTIPAERPNVLIIWDNTANWNANITGGTAYSVEKAALQTVVNGLTDQFNVGLMLFTETGGGNSNVRGTYPRYAIRQMSSANRTAFASLIGGLNNSSDKGSNAQYARAMHEAYLYFGGRQAMAGYGQVKKDLAAFSSGDTYLSPIGDGCQKNYVIFISNGGPDSGENNASEALLTGLGGKLGTDPIVLNPSNDQANWADEYARYLRATDVNPAYTGNQNIVTYTLAVYDPTKINLNPVQSQIALMKSMAQQGGGKYYAATDSSSIVAALNAIFQEVQAVNSVFASTTLPVSVNVRGTNLNQVYIGVFRPDANLSPRWNGNLKMYNVGLDTATNSLFLSDRNGQPAQSSTTGFIDAGATSFWTSPSSFWGFRPSTENGVGGASDSPDGDLVEKGGVGQMLRNAYATAQTTRRLYTCTGTCTSGSPLSSTAFETANADISMGSLGAASSTERDAIINWVRGADNRDDENANGVLTDVRAYIHGDVLHSRPAVINYNRNSTGGTVDNNDVYAFYGSNDGLLRAVKGGTASDGGTEAWGFVPSEFFGKLKRLRDNNVPISSTNKRPYFADGPIGIYQKDVNGDGRLVAADGDKVHLYIGMRRGGRMIYALDVSDPTDPKFLWKRDNTSPGFGELGQTWSEPKVARIRASTNPVLIFGAGYDAAVEDQNPIPTGTANTMGRGVLVVDAITGDVLWQVGPAPSGATHNLTESAMVHAIPSDVSILDRNRDGYIDRIYVGDTGGNLWRVDLHDATPSNWTVRKLASISGSATADKRKFLFPPDVVYASDGNGPYDAVLIGSGDREHPFDSTVVNRYYMFKDRATGVTGGTDPTIAETDLYDATSNAIQGADATAAAAGVSALAAARGWMLTLATGEKVVGSSTTMAGTTFFNTNQPATAAPGTCGSNLGVARQYLVSYENATATTELNGVAGLTTADRSVVHPGGGYLPSPVPLVVELGNRKYQAVISGTDIKTPPAARLDARHRIYWYMSID